MTDTTFAAVETVLARDDDADEALRDVVKLLVRSHECSWAAISFVDDGHLLVGPESGHPGSGDRIDFPIMFQDTKVAELGADSVRDPDMLERIAALLAPYCLVGWDTGGETWDPSA